MASQWSARQSWGAVYGAADQKSTRKVRFMARVGWPPVGRPRVGSVASMTVHAAVLVADLRIRSSQSLKDKRSALRPLIDGLRHRFSLSVAETDHQDLLQRAGIAVAAAGPSADRLEDALDAVERFIWSFTDLEVLDVTRHWIEVDDDG